MRSIRRLMLAASLVCSAATPALAQTIDFEGLGSGSLPQGYAGFAWLGGFGSSSWIVADAAGANLNLTHSGTANIWSNGGTSLTMSRVNPFDFTSVWMSATNGSCNSSPTQTVTGWLSGVFVYSTTVALDCSQIQLYTFNYLNVDLVQWDVAAPSAVNLLLDDITVNGGATVPEPSSILLLAAGMAMIGIAARRRTRQAR